jgi:hypothetical protein
MITPLFSLLREQGISYGVIISHCERTHESDLELTPFLNVDQLTSNGGPTTQHRAYFFFFLG